MASALDVAMVEFKAQLAFLPRAYPQIPISPHTTPFWGARRYGPSLVPTHFANTARQRSLANGVSGG